MRFVLATASYPLAGRSDYVRSPAGQYQARRICNLKLLHSGGWHTSEPRIHVSFANCRYVSDPRYTVLHALGTSVGRN